MPQPMLMLLIFSWRKNVEGIEEARKRSGFHDEPLKGPLKGKRSIRLSKQWRAIYTVKRNKIEFVLVEKVTPHEYKK